MLLFNHSDNDFKIDYGERIAQLIIEQIADTILQEVPELEDTQRGAGGFGSTGITHNFNENNDDTNNPLFSLLNKIESNQSLPGNND